MNNFSKNQNVVAAQTTENQYGLLEVSFVCEGGPEFPTALRDGNSSRGKPWSIYDDPLCAFRNGQDTAKYPPQYSYHRANRQVPSWTCKSILFKDGSVYTPEEVAGEITELHKRRIFSASVNEWQYGLKLVEFSGVGLIGGKPIYPTALAKDKKLTDKPLDAFWNGEATTNVPFETRETDDNIGAVWSAKSIVFADGTPYSKDEQRESDELLESDKKRVFSASVNEWQYGLKLVEFSGVGLIGGKPIYPTALAKDKKLTDKPLDAFWNGDATTNIPFETRETDENVGAVWSAKSIVFADGTVYDKNESARDIKESDKKRVFSASVNEWQYGLKLVEFSGVGLIGGKPIYPTALAKDKKLTDKPLDAFWDGEATANIPFETRETDDNIGAVWSAKSIVFADGSAYSKDEKRGSDELNDSDKLRIYSARVFDAELGLKYVEFRGVGLINGKPIYPTALADEKSLLDSPLDAFWGGSEAIKLPHSVEISDDNVGVVWTTRVLVNGDGTAISTTEAITLREYYDIVDYNFPGRASITDYGIVEKPGATRKYKAKIVEKLVMNGGGTNSCTIPFGVQHWTFYSVCEFANGSLFEAKSIHGALTNGGNAGTRYRGKSGSFNTTLTSTPKFDEFVGSLKGSCIDCQVRRAFSDASGNDWYVIRTVTLVDGDFGVH
jgi:hypothetical protein